MSPWPSSVSLVTTAWRPECLPRKMPASLAARAMPIVSGWIISYVALFLSMPSWWIPLSCANALAPTIALCGCTFIPVYSDTMSEVGAMCTGAIPFQSPPPTSWSLPRNLMAITTSSSDAFPARSPMPLIVHSIWRAPLSAPASELAVLRPRSFWQCVEMTTFSTPTTFSLMPLMSVPNSCGRQMPTVSGMLMVVAPAATTAESTR
mmetsp:Transcript_9036/g.29676  ORF Transcript_9036/g.29676 Transcript_9036/m.29676 type:complete len:206 (+) Transcript_9036:1965-2582(+)